MKRKCIKCGAILGQDNTGSLCSPCQKGKARSKTESIDELCYNAKDLADILGFDDTESVMRLARKGELPPPIPNIKKYLWPKKVIHDWIDGGYLFNEQEKAISKATALGWPVGPASGYGYDIDHLVKEIKYYECQERQEPLPPELQDLDS